MSNSTLTQEQIDRINKTVAAARARRLAKDKAEAEAAALEATTKAKAKAKPEKKAPKPKLTEAEKTAAKAALEAKRAESKKARDEKREARKLVLDAKKAARAEARLAKKAARDLEKKIPHLAKVEKAGSTLPPTDEKVKELLDLIASSDLDRSQSAILAAHLQHLNRMAATFAAASAPKLNVGDRVVVVSSESDPRNIGLVGTVTEVRKIRVMVDVGRKRPVYLFVSDVVRDAGDPEEESTEDSTPTETEPEFLTPDDSDEEDESVADTGTEN